MSNILPFCTDDDVPDDVLVKVMAVFKDWAVDHVPKCATEAALLQWVNGQIFEAAALGSIFMAQMVGIEVNSEGLRFLADTQCWDAASEYLYRTCTWDEFFDDATALDLVALGMWDDAKAVQRSLAILDEVEAALKRARVRFNAAVAEQSAAFAAAATLPPASDPTGLEPRGG